MAAGHGEAINLFSSALVITKKSETKSETYLTSIFYTFWVFRISWDFNHPNRLDMLVIKKQTR